MHGRVHPKTVVGKELCVFAPSLPNTVSIAAVLRVAEKQLNYDL